MFTCLRARVLCVFTCMRVHVIVVLLCLHAYVLGVVACLEWLGTWRAWRAFVLACITYVLPMIRAWNAQYWRTRVFV